MSYNTQDSPPQQRISQPKMSIVLRLRIPAPASVSIHTLETGGQKVKDRPGDQGPQKAYEGSHSAREGGMSVCTRAGDKTQPLETGHQQLPGQREQQI